MEPISEVTDLVAYGDFAFADRKLGFLISITGGEYTDETFEC